MTTVTGAPTTSPSRSEPVSRPCHDCPWTQKGQPDITPDIRETAEAGAWFCCHVNLGPCFGARVATDRR